MHLIASNHKKFSLVEIVFSLGIVSMLILVIIYAFRNNLISFRTGNIKMDNQSSISLLTKRIYTDFKNINPAIYFDARFHLWFQGEKLGDIYPNLITLEDLDNDKKNGYEKVTLFQTSIKNIGKGGKVNGIPIIYELRDEKLFRSYDGVEKQILEEVTLFHIHKNGESDRHLKIDLEFKLKESELQKNITEEIHLSIAMDTDLIHVKSSGDQL